MCTYKKINTHADHPRYKKKDSEESLLTFEKSVTIQLLTYVEVDMECY